MDTLATDTLPALKFITCGSVDDGKSTLIGRLLVDSKAVLQDQLAGVQRSGETDLALLTDGLSAEREQGITIDVAYRYFSTARRKFIIGDAPGHEQYTRNMVTAASSADCAVVLVDAIKLDWQNPALELLPQTRRHALLVNLLRVRSIVFVVNKLDAVANPDVAFVNIRTALNAFAGAANIAVHAVIPISALTGHNVVDAQPGWCGYHGPALLHLLEALPVTAADTAEALAFPVQWVEKFSAASDTQHGRRIFWGRIATGNAQPGQRLTVLPGGQTATVAYVLNHVRKHCTVPAGYSAGIVLDREVDVSRGDWLHAAPTLVTACTALPPEGAECRASRPVGRDSTKSCCVSLQRGLQGSPCLGRPDAPAGTGLVLSREISATVAWMDDEPLVAGRVYWALHGHRWVKARVKRIVHRLDIDTLAESDADRLEPNAIGHVELTLQDALATLPYSRSRVLGSMVLVDTASHRTSGAVLVRESLACETQ